jgi:hypothetical protein
MFNRITAPIAEHTLHWSRWRRQSQMLHRSSHYKRRTHHNLSLSY